MSHNLQRGDITNLLSYVLSKVALKGDSWGNDDSFLFCVNDAYKFI